jgi:Protein of unknown function (DUF2914)
MSEQKNIVIKVKYPSSVNAPDKTGTQPDVITEWNFKRIGFVLGSVFLILMMLSFFSNNDDQQVTTSSAQLSVPQKVPEIKPQPDDVVNTPDKTNLDINKVVARAQLTHDIKKNEPVDNLKIPLKIGKRESLWIYYFVELKAMEGKIIYHEWWLNGNLVSRKKVNITDDPWRTASKQLITYTNNNDWIVRIVDEGRNKFAEQSFNLELE